MSRLSTIPVVLIAAFALHAPLTAAEYQVDAAQSVFAVLTHKAGIASGFAHDHLIVAGKPAVHLEFDPARPEGTRFTFVVAVETLDVDAPASRTAWKGRLHELGVHSGELPPVPDSDRNKVRSAMLGESQLAGASFPEIRAEVAGLKRGEGAGQGTWNLSLRLTIRGKSTERS
ncbi:MAG: hypothetical protein ABIV06_14235, partial [Thermoanaerobaculia bacterium]